MPKMIKDARGKFTGRAPDPDTDWKRPHALVWERSAEPEPQPVIEAKPVIKLSGRTEAAGFTVNYPSGPKEQTQIIGALQRAPKGQRSNRCCKCGGETDTTKTSYCKPCWAEYQRERYQRKKYEAN